jgi:hypothetical protein
MRIEKTDATVAKGWCFGSWNADLGIAVGFAFVIHTPALQGEAAKADTVPVSRTRLRLSQCNPKYAPQPC